MLGFLWLWGLTRQPPFLLLSSFLLSPVFPHPLNTISLKCPELGEQRGHENLQMRTRDSPLVLVCSARLPSERFLDRWNP